MSKGPTLAELELESAHDTIRGVMEEQSKEEPKTDGDNTPVPASETRRDEKGRFAKASDEPDETDERPAGDTEEEVATEGLGGAAQEDEPEGIDPPHEWEAADQDEFRALPRKAQELVLARYNSSKTVEQEATALKQRYTALDELINPRREALHRDGLDEVSYLRQLMALSDQAGKDPAGFVRWFAQQRGLTPQQIFQMQQSGVDPTEGMDPQLRQLMESNRQLSEQLNGIKQGMSAQQEAAQKAQTQQILGEISQFGAAKDDKGRATHPYFEEVRALMGTLMGAGQAPDLATAYDMACSAHPGVRDKIESAKRAHAAQEDARKQREKAAAAKKAGSSVTGTPGDRSKPALSGDLREDLYATARERGLIA